MGACVSPSTLLNSQIGVFHIIIFSSSCFPNFLLFFLLRFFLLFILHQCQLPEPVRALFSHKIDTAFIRHECAPWRSWTDYIVQTKHKAHTGFLFVAAIVVFRSESDDHMNAAFIVMLPVLCGFSCWHGREFCENYFYFRCAKHVSVEARSTSSQRLELNSSNARVC